MIHVSCCVRFWTLWPCQPWAIFALAAMLAQKPQQLQKHMLGIPHSDSFWLDFKGLALVISCPFAPLCIFIQTKGAGNWSSAKAWSVGYASELQIAILHSSLFRSFQISLFQFFQLIKSHQIDSNCVRNSLWGFLKSCLLKLNIAIWALKLNYLILGFPGISRFGDYSKNPRSQNNHSWFSKPWHQMRILTLHDFYRFPWLHKVYIVKPCYSKGTSSAAGGTIRRLAAQCQSSSNGNAGAQAEQCRNNVEMTRATMQWWIKRVVNRLKWWLIRCLIRCLIRWLTILINCKLLRLFTFCHRSFQRNHPETSPGTNFNQFNRNIKLCSRPAGEHLGDLNNKNIFKNKTKVFF